MRIKFLYILVLILVIGSLFWGLQRSSAYDVFDFFAGNKSTASMTLNVYRSLYGDEIIEEMVNKLSYGYSLYCLRVVRGLYSAMNHEKLKNLLIKYNKEGQWNNKLACQAALIEVFNDYNFLRLVYKRAKHSSVDEANTIAVFTDPRIYLFRYLELSEDFYYKKIDVKGDIEITFEELIQASPKFKIDENGDVKLSNK